MKEQQGNIFAPEFQNTIKLITTNGIVKSDGTAVMGAGLALAAAKINPWMPAKLGKFINEYGNRPFNLGEGYASFPTKNHWRDPSDLLLIIYSATMLVEMADKFNWEHIVSVKPGCGLGGLQWPDVRAEILPIFDDRFTILV